MTREQWVKALRSGKYKLGRRRLRIGDTFCCLGVLCDLNDPSLWALNDLSNEYDYVYAEEYSAMPPVDLLIEVGISDDEAHELAEQNDAGATFEEIADMIESGEIFATDYDSDDLDDEEEDED